MLAIETRDLRAEFPLTKRMTYLDTAYHNILPSSVVGAVETFCREELQGGGNPHSWDGGVEATREKFARLIGADRAEVAFVKNTADGINIVASALPLRRGDNVVINDLDHASNIYPWRNLERLGVEMRVVSNVGGRLPVPELLAATDARTRVLAISAVQYANGFRCDLAGLAEYCRPRRVYLVVDAIQAIGTLGFDVGALGVDMLACGGHKGLLAPYGIGGLYVRRDLISELQPSYLAGEGVQQKGVAEEIRLRDDAVRFEVGNYNVVGIAGLSAGLDILLEVGVGAIERHVLQLSSQLIEGLTKRGVTVITPLGKGERSSIVVFALPDAERAVERFEANSVRVALRRGNVRASFHLYNGEREIGRLLTLVDGHMASH